MVGEKYKRRPAKKAVDDFVDFMEYLPELLDHSYRPNYSETLEDRTNCNSRPRGNGYEFTQTCKPGPTKAVYEFTSDQHEDTDAEYIENTHAVENTPSVVDDMSTGIESLPIKLFFRIYIA